MKMKTILLLDLLLVFILSATNTEIPKKIHIKYFGETKKSYVLESSSFYNGFPVTFTGNIKIAITGQNTKDLQFYRTDLNWQGEEKVVFNLDGVQPDTAIIVCKLFDLPDTLFVRYGNNDPGTGFDLSEYFYGYRDSVDYHKNIEWSGNSKYSISKLGWKLIVKKSDESNLDTEKVVFSVKATDSGIIYKDTITFICSNEQDPYNLKKYSIGDLYQYKIWNSHGPSSYITRKIVGTEINDNYFCYKLQFNNDPNYYLLRGSTRNRIYEDSEIYDFTFETGDIINSPRFCKVEKSKKILFNKEILMLRYIDDDGSGDLFLLESSSFFGYLTEQHDLIKSTKGQHYGIYLTGAIIDGVQYGAIVGIEDSENIFSNSLSSNYPNPFNPSTMIQFSLAKPAMTELKVYNSSGEVVKTLIKGICNAGNQHVQFDGSSLASGVYYYRLTTPEQSLSGKMMLIK